MRKIERLINLLAFLLDSRRPRPLSEIRSKVAGYDVDDSDEAFKRRFERDKDELRELGVPIESTEEGYLVSKREYYLPEIRFAVDEVITLGLAAQLARYQPAMPGHRHLKGALLKIFFDQPDGVVGEGGSMARVKLGGDSELADRLEALDRAIVNRKAVGFSYLGLKDGQARSRAVEPYGRYYREGSWYLVGRCLEQEEVRTFRVDRMVGEAEVNQARLHSPDFEMPAEFALEDYAARESWQLGDGELPVTARLRLNRPVPGVAMTNQKTPGAEVDVPVGNRAAFVRWCLARAGQVEVLGPPELKEEVAAYLAGIEALYAGEGA